MRLNIRKYDVGFPVLGIYADIQKVCICVVNVYLLKGDFKYGKRQFYKKWEVLEEFTTQNIDIDECLDNSKRFIWEYRIKQGFCNTIGVEICDIKDAFYRHTKEQYEGIEIVELQPERLLFLVQGNIERISIDGSIREMWEEEFNKFDIEAIRNNLISYPRVFALANVIKGCQARISGSLIG